MNDDAFARRFYADRAELESLGIELKVDKPAEGYYEAENYSLPPENFYLPAIEFTDEELGALQTSLSLLDGEFAYAEPLRLALQQLSWGKPSPLDAPEQRSVALGRHRGAGGRELSQRLSKVETAIFRRKTIVFDYYSIGRDAAEKRKVDPYHLLYQGGQFYLSATRTSARTCASSGSRGSAARSATRPRPSTTSRRPEDFDPRVYATRTDWQLGDPSATRAHLDLGADRLAGASATSATPADGHRATDGDGVHLRDRVRGLAPAGLLGARARRARPLLEPPELVDEARRAARADRRAPHRHGPELAPAASADGRRGRRGARTPTARRETPIRPERFARLVTLAGILIDAAREGRQARGQRRLRAPPDHRAGAARGHRRAERRELRRRQLRALRRGPGRQDRGRPRALRRQLRPPGAPPCRSRRRRWSRRSTCSATTCPRARSPPRARRSSPRSARTRPPRACRSPQPRATTPRSPAWSAGRSSDDRLLEIEYYKENEDEFTERTIEPYELINGREGWYVHSYDPAQGRHAHLPARPHQARRRCSTRRSSRGEGIDARRARLAPHRRGARLAHRPRLDLARARPLGARGPARGGGADGRSPGRRAARRRRTSGWRARSSRRPATPPCSSPRTPARPCSRRPSRSRESSAARPLPRQAADRRELVLLHRLERLHGARRGLDLLRFRKVLVLGRGAVLRELPRRDQHPALERAHGLVVGLHRCSSWRPSFEKWPASVPRRPWSSRPRSLTVAGALRHLLLPPAVGHRAQQRDQRGGRGDQHLLRHAVLDQRRASARARR